MVAGGSKVTREDKQRLRELTETIDRVELDRPSVLPVLVPALRELVAAYSSTAYSIRISGEGIRIPSMHIRWASTSAHTIRPFVDYIHTTQLHWGFDVRRPETAQRNRIVATGDPSLLLRGMIPVPRNVSPRELPSVEAYLEVLTKVGWARPMARVLVCDGPRLLAYVGFCNDEETTPRQRALLRALVPSLRRRLIAEARLGAGESWRVALDVALEQIGAPAFVIGADGAIAVANRAGHDWYDREPSRVSEVLRDRPPALEVTAFVGGGERGSLCVYRGEAPWQAAHVRAAAATWQLTPRQTEVLALVARGHTNARIAAELGCVEGTVEIHVSRILDRAQVESRAALIAELLWRRSV